MRRRRRQAASLAVLLALGGVVAAHHGELTGGHQSGPGAAMSAGHETHKPPAPAVEADIGLAVCLAVLPLLAVIGLATLGAPVRRWSLRIFRAPAEPALPSESSAARRSRAGPRLLCVMRC
jgi:hypothetical protein